MIILLRKIIAGFFVIGLLTALIIGGFSCSGQKMGKEGGYSPNGGNSIQLQGSGSTFVKPLMDKWTSEFGKLNTSVKIDYQSTGSGAGIKAIQNRTSDFGATDAAMSDEEMKQSPGEIVHIPVVLGAVVITYNLEGLTQPLRLSPNLISDIYLGKIKKWNDEKIKTENPALALPDADITPVFRADGSGTSDVFTDFLSKTVPEWKERIGRTKNPQLPEGVGIGAKGNEGVMGQVKNTPNTIGYVELTFAKANNLPVALIKNSIGNYVEANSKTIGSAADEIAANIPDDLRAQFTNAKAADAYPISGIVYILVYKDQPDEARGRSLADFLWWITHDGTKFVEELHYAPLPASMVAKVEAKIKYLTSEGKALKQ